MASSSSASTPTPTPTSGSVNNNVYEVFINFRGPDVRKTFGSHLYRRLLSHGLRVFFAVPFWQQGERLDSQIKGAIRTASVFVAILSPAYAESKWCLDELHMMLESGAPVVPLFYHVKPFELLEGGQNFPCRIKDAVAKASVHVAIFSPRYPESNWCMDELILMLESGTPIIPVFYHVKPADLRWTRLKNKSWWRPVKNGVYAEALHKIEMKKRFDSDTIENWRKALSTVADINGFDLETFNGDEGALLNKVVQRVLDCGKG